MSDSFGTFLKGSNRRGLQDPLSLPRLILAAVVDADPNSPMTDVALKDATGQGPNEIKKALQLLADEGLVTARPEKGTLVVQATQRGKVVRAT